jgi:hypothetical protein
MFNAATRTLFEESSQLFGLMLPDKLFDFMERVKDRVILQGYSEIFQIPDNSQVPPVTRDFLVHYGALSLEDFRLHVMTYVFVTPRTAQDSFQLYNMLMNSLSVAGRAKLAVCEATFTVTGVKSGVLLLKRIIQLSMIDTQATASFIFEPSFRASIFTCRRYPLSETLWPMNTLRNPAMLTTNCKS